jgi:signal transduction histidine kinase
MRRRPRLDTVGVVPTEGLVTRALERSWRPPLWLVDAGLGTLIVIAGLATTSDRVSASGRVLRSRDALAFGLILAATLPYYLRRRAPVAVFLTTAASVAVLMLRGYDAGALPLALFVGAYTVAAYRPAGEVVASAALIGALLVVVLVGDTPEFHAGDLVSSSVAFATSVLIGWTMQSRRRRIEAFEGEQQEAALRAAADERLRIARELHDVVAHSLGVIAVQAGVGMKVIDSDVAEARNSLENISRASRASLAEIRLVLGIIRSADGTPTYTPAPGLADLPRLAEEVTGAGLPVDLDVDGGIGEVPPGVGLAAYRIVQEALTNALRHAGAQRATVRLGRGPDALVVEVTDDGRGANGGRPGGHGLVGMEERVAVYGGSLDAGPCPGGGFRVTARLPHDTDPVA